MGYIADFLFIACRTMGHRRRKRARGCLEDATEGTLTALQFELTGSNLRQLTLVSKLAGHHLSYNVEGNRLAGIIFSTSNDPIGIGYVDLIEINGGSDFKWGEVNAANISTPMAERVAVRKHGSFTQEYMLSVSPNPSRGFFNVNYSVPVASHVELFIKDMLSRDIELLLKSVHNQGSYQLRYTAKTVLQPGFYILQMIATDESRQGTTCKREVKVVIVDYTGFKLELMVNLNNLNSSFGFYLPVLIG